MYSEYNNFPQNRCTYVKFKYITLIYSKDTGKFRLGNFVLKLEVGVKLSFILNI